MPPLEPPTAITITGRVRAQAAMPSPAGRAACVVLTSWSKERPFPRTTGLCVPFEVETHEGETFRVDPLPAAVSVPVRSRGATEEGWIATGDEVTVEGLIVSAANGAPAALRAIRVSAKRSGPAIPHRLPPGSLGEGRPEVRAGDPETPGSGEPPPRPRRKTRP